MNELPPAPQDTPWREMGYYDATIQDYPRIPSYMIVDEEGRKSGPLFVPTASEPQYAYEWSKDNSVEIDRGWVKKGETIEALARQIRVEPSVLKETLERWNACCSKGEDPEYRRQPNTMVRIDSPPYYAVEVWPVVTNTQGGIAHNVRQQVIDTRDEPIPRLYVAGELSSVFGHLYLQSGNNSECVIAGRLAAKYAHEEEPLEELSGL